MWGSQHFGLRPDILTCAKALTSGYVPISAVLVNERVFRPIAEQSADIGVLGHGFTYSGHPVAAAVALETLDIYDEIDLLGMVRAAAPTLQDGIRQFADHPLVGEATGIGMLAVAELVANKTMKQPFDAVRKVGLHLVERALDHGLIVRALGDRIGFSPPLVMQPDQITRMFARFAEALDETWAWVRQ
jgi:4-aminobutyrate--pyruvate transaminase